jgi:acetyl-CoA carboxylase biotin carboxyl carrier protein
VALTLAEIQELLAALESSGWDEAEIVVGDVTITVSRNGPAVAAGPPVSVSAPASASVPAALPAPVTPVSPASAPGLVAAQDGGHVIASPTVGVFWRSPSPGAPPYVEVGSAVRAGDTLCIVEVMKLMNNVVTDVDGVVAAIHLDNSQGVQAGTALFTIKTA